MSYSFEYETQIDLGGDEEEEIQVAGELDVSYSEYGADADGNRGEMRYETELVEFKAYRATGEEITDEKLLEIIEKDYDKNHSEKYEQEAIDSYDEPDYDYDDCDRGADQ